MQRLATFAFWAVVNFDISTPTWIFPYVHKQFHEKTTRTCFQEFTTFYNEEVRLNTVIIQCACVVPVCRTVIHIERPGCLESGTRNKLLEVAVSQPVTPEQSTHFRACPAQSWGVQERTALFCTRGVRRVCSLAALPFEVLQCVGGTHSGQLD